MEQAASPPALAPYVRLYGAAIVKELGLNWRVDETLDLAESGLELSFTTLCAELDKLVGGRPSRSLALNEMVHQIRSEARPPMTRPLVGDWVSLGADTPLCLIGPLPWDRLAKYANVLWSERVTQVVALETASWWPEQGETTVLGEITVATKQIEEIGTGGVVARLYHCTLMREGELHPLTVLRLFWKDFGTVAPAALLKVLKTFESCVRVGPSAVHCRAGLGRSGTFVAIRALVQTLRSEHGGSLDLFEAGICSFVAVRAQRSGAVELLEQFASIFEAGRIMRGE